MNARTALAGLAAWAVCAAGAAGESTAPAEALAGLRHRAEALGHGYVSAAEWRALADELDALTVRADAAADYETAVASRLVKAQAIAGLRGQLDEALAVLRETRARWADHTPVAMRPVFVYEAELRARRGEETAIRQLMGAYRNSPWYVPEPFAYTVGEGRDTPLAIKRPYARGSDDLTLTAMARYLAQGRTAGGDLFPEFAIEDVDGARLSRTSLAGRVVLVDVWVSGSVPWHEQLPARIALYRRHRADGLEIVGICQNLSAPSLRDFRRRNRDASWPQATAAAAQPLLRELGLYGDAASYLLDREGRVVARNLSGADLAEAVRRALAR
jgi:hypothetical protein